MQTFIQYAKGIGVLFAVAAITATLVNATRPSGSIAWVEDWSRHIEAKARKEGLLLADLVAAKAILKEGKSLILDARSLADYSAGHLPGAKPLPYDSIDEHFAGVMEQLTPDRPVLAYCSGLECDDSFLLAKFLRQQGFTNIVLFAEGFTTAWQTAGLPVEKGAAP